MAIRVDLPKKVNGADLARIVEESMNDLTGYKISRGSVYGYEYGSVKKAEQVREINTRKGLKLEHILPLTGIGFFPWLFCFTYGKSTFSTNIDLKKEYDSLEMFAGRYQTEINSANSKKFRGRLQPDFEKLVQGIYRRIDALPQAA
ncbi:hypothetical protein HY212_03410 [Candidatus Pacearchaeota archaeon]|nr:hypothetical protein [Candidatus Pacearchaeota archaeon]